MVYVQRDAGGKIISVSQQPTEGFEEIAVNQPEVIEFLASINSERESLINSDLDFVRVVEDLVEVLVDKNFIRFTDLPEQAQHKMLNRQQLRSALKPHLDLLSDDEEGFL